jgi:hypothetical protein
MKTGIYIFTYLIFAIAVFSCSKEDAADNLDCRILQAGIINYDLEIVRVELAKLTGDLYPSPSLNDEIGHENNFNILIDRLNNCERITATSFCYACIKTLPAQSEILVTTDSSGQSISRIIDIITAENNTLKFSGVHMAYN